jgi:hypothetical protein
MKRVRPQSAKTPIGALGRYFAELLTALLAHIPMAVSA